MALFYMHGVPVGYVAILLALVASMGGFIFGYDTGQISDILLMDDFLVRFATCSTPGVASTCHFSTARAGLIVSLLSIGTLVGALLGAPIADFLGRRYAMVVECILFIIGVIIQITATNAWQQFGMGRWVSGLGVGALSAAVPMYQAETAPARLRGTLTATYQLFITFGILVAYCISIGTRHMPGAGSWRTVVGIGFIWPFILMCGIIFMPESPRWLASHGRPKEARHSLARSHGIPRDQENSDPFLNAKVEEVSTSIEHERRICAGWIDCFRPKHKTLYRTLLVMIVSACMFILGFSTTWAPGIWILTACNLVGAVIVFFFLYESSDLSLESVDLMYNDPKCRPWTSRQWAPPGYRSRYDLAQQNKAAGANKVVGPSGADESRIEKVDYGDANGIGTSATSTAFSSEDEH
ncbi:hypothetical protein C0989_012600 [Termitomyces sp. Mn162]|nr:hypothetical protein C0989_012600 [Termitomyces sp. Mn162]